MDKALKDQLHLFRLDVSDGSKIKAKDSTHTISSETHYPSSGISTSASNSLFYGISSTQSSNVSAVPSASPFQRVPQQMAPVFPTTNPYSGVPLHGGDITNAGILSATPVRPQANLQSKMRNDAEERKKLETERQQRKIRQSFHMLQNKVVNPDDLLNKIASAFQPTMKQPISTAASVPNKLPTSESKEKIVQKEAVLSVQQEQNIKLSHSTNVAQAPEMTDMMLKFSDLSASAVASKGFQRPQRTADVPTPSKKQTSFDDSQTARDWKRLPDDITAAFTSVSDSSQNHKLSVDLPPWCYDMNSLPAEYHLILGYFRNQAALDKASVFPFLTRSGLSNFTIEHVWKNVCRTKPGYLTRGELCAALALIGLAQSSFDVHHLTVEVLRRLPSPPIPQFASRAPKAEALPTVSSQSVLFGNSSLPTAAFQNIALNIVPSSPLPPMTSSTNMEDEFADFVSASLPAVPLQNQLESNPNVLISSVPGSKSLKPVIPGLDSISHLVGSVGLSFAEVSPAPTSDTSKKHVEIKAMPLGWAITEKKPSITEEQDDWLSWTEASVLSSIVNFPSESTLAPSVKILEDESSVSAQAQADRYSALRELFPAAPVEDTAIATEIKIDWGFSSMSVKEPSSSDLTPKASFKTPAVDNLSLNSLDLGNCTRLNLDGETTPEFAENRSSPDPDGSSSHVDSTGTPKNFTPEAVFTQVILVCSGIIREAVGVFNSIADSKTLLEVISKAKDYVRGVIEVYRVGKKISLSAKSYGMLHNSELLNVLAEMEEIWADFVVFLSLCSLEAQPGTLDFSPCLFSVQQPAVNNAVCGLCLLNVDEKSKVKGSLTDGIKIEVDDRFYHISCANFWLNLISDTLPRLHQVEDYF